MKKSASLPLVTQSFRPVSQEVGAALWVLHGARGHREGVATGAGLRQGVRADGAGGQLREESPFDVVRAPPEQRVDNERVLHIHQNGDGRVHTGELFDRHHRQEEVRARATVAFRNLDGHDPQGEQLIDERARNLALFVHLPYARPHLGLGERPNVGAQELFVLRQTRERGAGRQHPTSSTLLNAAMVSLRTPPADSEAYMLSAVRPRWVLPVLLLAVLIVTGRAEPQQPPQPPDQASAAGDTAPEQQPAEQEPPVPIFRTGINFIRVDAIVTDGDDNPVTDLTVDDFEIIEDGAPQTVESFQLVEISAVPAPDAEPARPIFNEYDAEREAARADVRLFVIFFDDYHVREENGLRAGRRLAEFLQNNLLPTDLVGIMYPLTPLADVRLTRNHAAIVDAVQNLEGVKYKYEVRNEFEARYNHYPTTIVERIRNDVSLSALKGLMIHMGGVREGRKHVLLVSEGYTNYVPPQLRARDAMSGSNPFDNPARADPFAGDDHFEERYELFENSSLLLDLREVFSTANRFNTAIYSLDPRGLATGEFDVSQPSISFRTDARTLRSTQDTLYVLAEETDGRAIINRNDFAPGLQQMLRDGSTYYLLGYNSTRTANDGKFHEITVRVKRDGVRVRSRKGYWAITERDAERALTTTVNEPPKAVDTALAALVDSNRRGRLVRTWVGTSKGENGKTRVTFVWEPTSEGRRGDQPSRVLLTAVGDTGGAYYRGRVPELDQRVGRGTARARNASTTPAMMKVEFEADPGTMQMSLAVEGEGGEVLDRDLDEIEIPDFTGTDVVISTPSFVRARNNLEWKELVEDWDAVPSTGREFRRTERLLVRFEAYAPGTSVPDIKARLLNRGGDPMYPLDIQPAADGHPYQVDLMPVSLPPGEYVIELQASTPESETTQLVAFSLTS